MRATLAGQFLKCANIEELDGVRASGYIYSLPPFDPLCVQINAISNKWLPLDADFILVHLGTNDCGQGHNATTMESNMVTLLATIKAGNPDATTIVASVINFAWNSMPPACSTFNTDLPALVAAAKASGQSVVFADVNKRSNWCNGPVAGFPCTGVHPT
jgi:hypothetical protein